MNIDIIEQGTRWYETYEVPEARRAGKGVGFLVNIGGFRAIEYVKRGTSYDDLQPGNGYSYLIALHNLVDVQAQVLIDKLELARPLTDAEKRTQRDKATNMGPCARMGGELLVALPGFHRSFVLSETAYHTPDYVEEKIKLGYEHAVPLAIFLSAFSARVMELRGG